MQSYITVKNPSVFEYEDRKSVFIGMAMPVSTEAEAIAFIDSVKKQYPDARHHVYAYALRENSTMRFTDDREPQGTAGMPVLDIIRKNGCTDTVIVVTRYFGGTLLGTGGLVRAYSGATKEGLLASKVITKMHGQKLAVQTDYTGLGKIQYLLGQRGIRILNSVYTDKVELEVLLPEAEIESVMSEIREGTNGQAIMELSEECYFADVGGEMQIFED